MILHQLFPYSNFLIWLINPFHFEIFHLFNQTLSFSAFHTAKVYRMFPFSALFWLFGSNMRSKSTIFPSLFLYLSTVTTFYLTFLMTSLIAVSLMQWNTQSKLFRYFFLTRSTILASLTKWLFSCTHFVQQQGNSLCFLSVTLIIFISPLGSYLTCGTKYSRMDQVKFVEDSL